MLIVETIARITATVPVSYEAADAPLLVEEDDDGTIEPTAALDDRTEDVDDDEDGAGEGEDDAP